MTYSGNLPACRLNPAKQIDLFQLYTAVGRRAPYRLRSMVCYYGRHYSAFVRLPELGDRCAAAVLGGRVW